MIFNPAGFAQVVWESPSLIGPLGSEKPTLKVSLPSGQDFTPSLGVAVKMGVLSTVHTLHTTHQIQPLLSRQYSTSQQNPR